MDGLRLLRHATSVNRAGKKLFDKATLLRLQTVISEGEATHRGEVRLIVESAMPLRKVWRGMTARQRALDLFGSFRVWDTDEKTGVLLYINLTDRALEVISDRTASKRTGDQYWLFACQLAQEAFKHGDFERGTIAAIDAIHQALRSTFPIEGRPPGAVRPEVAIAR